MSLALSRLIGAIVLGILALLAAAAPGPAVEWREPRDIALGGGAKGPWRQNDSHYDYVDDGTAAFLHDGVLAVAWVDQRRKDVLFQIADAAPVNVSRSSATFSWHPRIAVGAKDQVYLLWQEIIFSGGSHGGDILFARSLDGGRSFSAPLNLSASMGGDGKGRLDRATWSNGSLDLAVAADGALLAAWTEFDGALWLARSRDGGASFSRPIRIAGDTRLPARAPALAAGASGMVALAWTVGEDRDADIRIAMSRDGGASFGAPRLVGARDALADAPRLVFDQRGVLHLVYAEQPHRWRDASRIMATRLRHAKAGFEAPRILSAAGAGYPALSGDAQGRLFVLWEMFPQRGARPRGLALAVSLDGGDAYVAPQRVPGSTPDEGSNGSYQGLLGKKLAVKGDGGIAVVNSNLASGKGSRIWVVSGKLR